MQLTYYFILQEPSNTLSLVEGPWCRRLFSPLAPLSSVSAMELQLGVHARVDSWISLCPPLVVTSHVPLRDDATLRSAIRDMLYILVS
ncbi:hypothetical protein FKM82_002353 [Ascaphus truei]